MSAEDKNHAPIVVLHVFSGPHRGSRLELHEGGWVLGSGDSCDIILSELAARHAALAISAGKAAGGAAVSLSPLDGSLYLEGEEEISPPEPGEQARSCAPAAGAAWYLGTTCFVWNRPGVEQRAPAREDRVRAASSPAHDHDGASSAAPTGNEVTSPVKNANLLGVSSGTPAEAASGTAPVAMPSPALPRRKFERFRRFWGLAALAGILAALSLALTPSSPSIQQYPDIVKQYLDDAHISGLTVTLREPGVELRGSVADDEAMIRLRDMARALHFPVYLEVGVQEDILRAVRSSLGIRGFHPKVAMTDKDASPRLSVAAYMKDAVLEAAAFSALKSEVRGLPPEDRHIVHEKELAPVLEETLARAGLASVRVLYLPGRVDFAGDFRPEEAAKLSAVRRAVGEHFGVPLYGSSVLSAPALPGAVQIAESGSGPDTGLSAASSGPLSAAAMGEDTEESDPLGGLRVTGVTMKPMRFVTTADGRRLFEGAVLPGGCILESIDTKVLTLRRGERIFTHRLRGSQ